jgi:hypothetical protein
MKSGLKRASGRAPPGRFSLDAAGPSFGHRLLEPVARHLLRLPDGGAAGLRLPTPRHVRRGPRAGSRPPVPVGRLGTGTVRRVDQGDGPDYAVRQAQIGIGIGIIAGGTHPGPECDHLGGQDAAQLAVRLPGRHPLHAMGGGDFGPAGAVDGDSRSAADRPEGDGRPVVLTLCGIRCRVGLELGRDEVGEAAAALAGLGRISQQVEQPVGERPTRRMN